MSYHSVKLTKILNTLPEQGLPFALYRLPGKGQVHLVAQLNGMEKFSKRNTLQPQAKGFLFAPFAINQSSGTLFIPAHEHISLHPDDLANINLSHIAYPDFPQIQQTSETKFKQLIREAKKNIEKNIYTKIVLSRCVHINRKPTFDPLQFFRTVCTTYPHAFVSFIYSPGAGCWIGASPEVLLQYRKNIFTTYSLAGTKTSPNIPWSAKEKEEQRIVTDYLCRVMRQVTKKKPLVTAAQTVAAGNLFHLRSIVRVHTATYDSWLHLVRLIHPSPAVAGYPKAEAVQFILRHEQAPRLYYGGYLGPVNLHNEINLYVNLRCMLVGSKRLTLYAGCGITASSSPQAEWSETENKLNTLRTILEHAT
ncbi:MAG: chorismate-binding protein [Chitinophagales bacterium]|nr:chorismate-binding protein [Chitinophagales bacterium]MDW8419887.1 chorismate-binding protein [Chitinophagales bacterium]